MGCPSLHLLTVLTGDSFLEYTHPPEETLSSSRHILPFMTPDPASEYTFPSTRSSLTHYINLPLSLFTSLWNSLVFSDLASGISCLIPSLFFAISSLQIIRRFTLALANFLLINTWGSLSAGLPPTFHFFFFFFFFFFLGGGGGGGGTTSCRLR